MRPPSHYAKEAHTRHLSTRPSAYLRGTCNTCTVTPRGQEYPASSRSLHTNHESRIPSTTSTSSPQGSNTRHPCTAFLFRPHCVPANRNQKGAVDPPNTHTSRYRLGFLLTSYRPFRPFPPRARKGKFDDTADDAMFSRSLPQRCRSQQHQQPH